MEPSEYVFKALLEAEGKCTKNEGKPHRWSPPIWLSNSRAWLRRCELCKAVEVWRGNDTIYLERSCKVFIVFHHKHEFTKNTETAIKFLREAEMEAEEIEWEKYSSQKKNTK